MLIRTDVKSVTEFGMSTPYVDEIDKSRVVLFESDTQEVFIKLTHAQVLSLSKQLAFEIPRR